jgi:hypothetical protein
VQNGRVETIASRKVVVAREKAKAGDPIRRGFVD